jgi:hypothetical protein
MSKKEVKMTNEINQAAWEKHISGLVKPNMYGISYIPIEDYPSTKRMEYTIFPCNIDDFDNIRFIFQKIYPGRWLANRSYITGH